MATKYIVDNLNGQTINGGLSATTMSATTFYGDGTNLTGIASSPISLSGTSLYSNNPSTSNFNAANSIFFGSNAGYQATDANNSNFLGYEAGYGATSASNSNFMGLSAGYQSINGFFSNFLGANAGYQSNYIGSSNFIGLNAGYQANASYNSNFIGNQAGYQATNAQNSNFIGIFAGSGSSSTNRSTFIGWQVGKGLSNSPNNIIIGTNISLPDSTSNSINIGSVLFGTGTYDDINTEPLTTPSNNGKIGIQIVTPTSTLDVSGVTGYDQFRLRTTYTPTGSTDTNGNVGDIAWDDNYFYWKTSTQWLRVTGGTW